MYVRYRTNFVWVGQIFLRCFVLGQKFSENLAMPQDKIFYPIGQSFLKFFCSRTIFSSYRTNIPMTGLVSNTALGFFSYSICHSTPPFVLVILYITRNSNIYSVASQPGLMLYLATFHQDLATLVVGLNVVLTQFIQPRDELPTQELLAQSVVVNVPEVYAICISMVTKNYVTLSPSCIVQLVE